MEEITLIIFDEKRWLVCSKSTFYDTAELAEWNWPAKDFLVREFSHQLKATCTISLAKLSKCKILLTTYRL